jgi:C-terminal processing protease CtpA/Prc
VLVNGLTFSQAIEVAGMIKKYGFGTLVGEPTTPLMSANARQFKLPNTQLTVTFPEAYYGDTSMINGVIPHHYIHDNVLTEKDEILDYTIKMIDKEIETK